MQKRYICFTCYTFHPEMQGVSEEEFEAGDNVCTQEKCTRKGESLELALMCSTCHKLHRSNTSHTHKSIKKK